MLDDSLKIVLLNIPLDVISIDFHHENTIAVFEDINSSKPFVLNLLDVLKLSLNLLVCIAHLTVNYNYFRGGN
jgi:hypothetical protein